MVARIWCLECVSDFTVPSNVVPQFPANNAVCHVVTPDGGTGASHSAAWQYAKAIVRSAPTFCPNVPNSVARRLLPLGDHLRGGAVGDAATTPTLPP